MGEEAAQAADAGTVTVSIARTVVPGREADYEDWLRGITAQALTFPGHMGVNVIRPGPGSREYVSIFRFDTYEHLRAWEESEVRASWLLKLDGIVEGEGTMRKGTGLEFWFSLPELPAAHPSPHKMALVLTVVVFCLVFCLNIVLAPLAQHLPSVAATLLGVICQVLLMTYIVMPRVTRALKGWLYRQQD